MDRGALWDGTGTSFAVHSASAERVELCLLGAPERRLPMARTPGHVWRARAEGVGPGQAYGFRVHGPGADPRHLLLDPYALQVRGDLDLRALDPGVDTAPFVPHAVVADPDAGGPAPVPLGTPWTRTVVYELHVRGFTAAHPGVPEALRGTYAGLAHPAAVQHLLDLGVTAVELLPVHAHVDEPHLLRRGLRNAWGYNSVGFFAPHAGYAATADPRAEFRAMVRALHDAGLEVLLDVVYNHTGEGDAAGPVLAWKGLDGATAYRRREDGAYDDVTGCGATLDLRTPEVLRTVLDSLRHWVGHFGVDGFRFDLAPALTRGSAFLDAVAQDPVLRGVKLVAEPWDLGPDGYRVGRFPHPWSEWDAELRDAVRDFWRGAGDVRVLATRLAGSADLFAHGGRAAWARTALVTAHDGFTLRDLTTYERKRNEANGEGNRDGSDAERGWNCGVEGETDDPAVEALRLRQAANLLATLLLSGGVPMLTMGDEVRRTQHGNNNAYCQVDLGAMPWEWGDDARALLATTRALVGLRGEVAREGFPTGLRDEDGVRDLGWFDVHGRDLTGEAWPEGDVRTLGLLHGGRLAAVLHSGADDVDVVLPEGTWDVVLDTAGRLAGRLSGAVRLASRSVLVARRAGR